MVFLRLAMNSRKDTDCNHIKDRKHGRSIERSYSEDRSAKGHFATHRMPLHTAAKNVRNLFLMGAGRQPFQGFSLSRSLHGLHVRPAGKPETDCRTWARTHDKHRGLEPSTSRPSIRRMAWLRVFVLLCTSWHECQNRVFFADSRSGNGRERGFHIKLGHGIFTL